MITQPKTKQEFEQWYASQLYYLHILVPGYAEFYDLPFTFQQGVYQEYFRSVGIEVYIEPEFIDQERTFYITYTQLQSTGEKIRQGKYWEAGMAWQTVFMYASEIRENQL